MRRRPVVNPQPRTEVEADGQRFTYGCSPAGYDLRLDRVKGAYQLGENLWRLDPGQFVLASTMEEFQMPDDLLGVVHDKSSWARRGLACQNTVIEPGWRGWLTLELNNHSTEPLRLRQGTGICQVIFHVLDEPTLHPYFGKYQDQKPGPQEAL
jgi:dCTP deaminase